MPSLSANSRSARISCGLSSSIKMRSRIRSAARSESVSRDTTSSLVTLVPSSISRLELRTSIWYTLSRSSKTASPGSTYLPPGRDRPSDLLQLEEEVCRAAADRNEAAEAARRRERPVEENRGRPEVLSQTLSSVGIALSADIVRRRSRAHSSPPSIGLPDRCRR